MAAPKRVKGKKLDRTIREEALDEVARLNAMGLTQHEIAQRLKVSQAQVYYDLKIIRKRYQESQLAARQELVNEKLAQLRFVRREAFKALELSGRDFRRVVIEEAEGKDGEVRETRITTTESRVPANEYMRTILETLKQERELLGLDEAKPLDIGVVGFDWNGLAARLGKPGQPLPDTVEQKLQHLLTETTAGQPSPKVVQQVPHTNGIHKGNTNGSTQ